MREVLATFSVLVDDRPLTKLDRRIDRLKQNIGRWATAGTAAAGAVGYGLFQLTEMASNAEQTVAGIGAVFKENRQAALDWADATGKAMGRSTNMLKKSVFDFGKFLRPTFEGTNTDILAMSENLTKLAVDLAAFNDTSFEEASMRLFSGMTGETEAVRRLGINISDEALKALAQERGDNRAIAKMSLAEKTQLRYIKILRDSRDAQGQAMREGKSWAGQLEEFKGILKDTGVAVGQFVMTYTLPALRAVRNAFLGLKDSWSFLENETSNIRALFVTAAAAITTKYVVAIIKATRANWLYISSLMHSAKVMLITQGGLLKMTKAAGIAVAAFLAIEDILTFWRGGESVFGDMIEWIFGTSDALGFLQGRFEDFFAFIFSSDEEKKQLQDSRILERGSRDRERAHAIATGDTGLFLSNLGTEIKQKDAKKIFLEQRSAYIQAHPEETTENDYNAGLIDDQGMMYTTIAKQQARRAKGIQMPGTNIVAGQKDPVAETTASKMGISPISDFSTPTAPSAAGIVFSGQGNSSKVYAPVFNISGGNPEEVRQIVQEEFGVMMRMDYHADGEEQ